MGLVEETGESAFYVRSDGTFFAFMENTQIGIGDALLKATPKGESKVYPFVAQASTADRDREGEILLQKGLNFEPFKEHGEFNWNHVSHIITGVPTGKKAWFEEPGWKCQGEIVSGMPIAGDFTTDDVVKQHNQLKKSGFQRGLCVSVEGKVRSRSKCGRFVAKADIYNIAHTFRPQNPNCTVSMLAKAMGGLVQVVERDRFYDAMDKSLAVSGVTPFMKEDFEGGSTKKADSMEDKLINHLVKKGYSKLEAKKHVYAYLSKKFSGKSRK